MKTVLQRYLLLTLLLFSQVVLAQDAGLQIATTEITQLAQEKNYDPKDVTAPIISDDYISRGIRHIYFQQTINQVGVYGTSGAVHLKGNEIVASNLNFVPQVDKRDLQSEFELEALEALARVAQDKGYPLSQTEVLIIDEDENSAQKTTTIYAGGISNRLIPLNLVYYIDGAQDVQLAWSLFIDEVADAEYKNFIVSATTGEILLEDDLTITCTFEHNHDHVHSTNCTKDVDRKDQITNAQIQRLTTNNMANDSLYNVLPYTIESPNFGNRTLLMNPWENPTASPNGWHHISGVDHQYTIGNNVDAYADRDNTNAPTGANLARAFGGPNLVFDHPWDPNGTQTNYTDAAITNLFYMNNVAHDLFYNYGFDEASGNFQEDNFNNGGNGGDHVFAEAQDASGSCNANMSTPGDGGNPRMQMYLCGGKDGDFDNGVILHEYGHGISNRLTGGPQAVACLGNVEQMGEGWSDFFGVLLTMKASDVATTNRTIGTFMFNQDANGAGLRPYPYTTDMSVNPMTYNTIGAAGISQPHGVGAVWATMLWDMTWALIDQYGWDADMYNGTGGNNIALHLVMEGLKLQPCSPGFVDGRDAILAADAILFGGANRCIIWEAFARRGLGYSAKQGSSNSRTDGIEGYDMPPECTIELTHSVDKTNAYLGERLTFQLTATNNLSAIAPNVIITDTLPEHVQFYSASDGGILNGNVVEWPAFNLAPGATKVVELKVTINDEIAFDPNFLDDLENGTDNWEILQLSGANNWNYQSQYYYSPSNSFFIVNANSTTETHLISKYPLALTNSSELSFNHYFDLEAGYDFGLVEISIDGGLNWMNLENDFIQNGYNNNTQFGYSAFSAASSAIEPNIVGFITSKADLSPYAGTVAIFRFRLLTDINTAEFGWILDDIGISNTNYALSNFSNIRNDDYSFDEQLTTPVVINQTLVNHTVETMTDTLITFENATLSYADVQANDIDIDGPNDLLTTTIIRTATNGTALVVNNDSISYVPNVDFLGLDTIVYQVCDQLNACESDTLFVFVNEAPNLAPVTQPDFITVDENSTNNSLDVQGNDTDPEGTILLTEIIKNANYGAATVNNASTILYTPVTDYFGLDTIVYQVCDPENLCSKDTVFLTIEAVNEAPITAADFLTINANTINNFIDVQANDYDPDGEDILTTILVKSATNGSTIVLNEDSLRYTPNADFSGKDTILYQVCDPSNLCTTDTVFVTVLMGNVPPVAAADYVEIDENDSSVFIDVQANDYDPNGSEDILITRILVGPKHGVANVINEDSLAYTPTIDYFGLDTIVYEVCDMDERCATDTVFITIKETFSCESEDLVKNESEVSTGNYVAANEINSEGIIKAGSSVKFVAGSSVTLLPGFLADAGADFTAMIDECESDNALSEAPNSESRHALPTTDLEINKLNKENNLAIRPNPFRRVATIDYELVTEGPVWIGLHDLAGKVLYVFVNRKEQSKGKYQYDLAAAKLSSGAYWLSMRTANGVITKKVIVLQD